MPNDAKTSLIKHLTQLNSEHKLHLSRMKISAICEDIIALFVSIKKFVTTHDYLSQKINDRIVWTPSYQKIIEHFKKELLDIIEPIGKISPLHYPNALWAGADGMVAAKHFGHPTLNTLPAYLIDLVFYDELKAEFFADMPKNIKDMAIVCIYWSLLSSIYADNIKGDVNIYLSENIIHCVSFFWNFELPILREKNSTAKIYLNCLTEEALKTVRELKKSGNNDVAINKLLTTKSHWQKRVMEDHLLLVTDEKSRGITYQRLSTFARHWKKQTEKHHNGLKAKL